MSNRKDTLRAVKVLLGVSGGISAYKSVDLASKLTAAGAKVQTVMTQAACQLIGPKSFEAVTCSAVFTKLWSSTEDYSSSHISLRQWSDVVVVAPATADIIGKTANGICDDLLSTTLCVCCGKPLLFAPAMNSNMWNNPAVQRNVAMLKEMGVEFIGPEQGRLACGTEGIGRMSEPEDILKAIEKIAAKNGK